MRSTARTVTVTFLTTVLIIGLALGALTGIGRLISEEPVVSPIGPATIGSPKPQPTFASSGQFGQPENLEPFQLPPWVVQLLIAIIVAVIALIVVRFLFMVASSIESRRNEVAVDAEPAVSVEIDLEVEEVQESLEQVLVDLRSGLDVHGAVIECWRRLADLAAESGVPRRASQTAEEYTLAILGSLPVDPGDLRTLAGLYKSAMFSGRDPRPADRDLAIGCFERLSASLAVRA